MMNKCLKIAVVAGAALIAGAAQASGHVITHAGDVPSKVGSHATFTGQVRHDSLAILIFPPTYETPHSWRIDQAVRAYSGTMSKTQGQS